MPRFTKEKAPTGMPRPPNRIIDKNQQLFDLGLSAKEMEDPALVQAKIEKLDSEFHFVLLAERFEESLVIMASYLCWDLSQVKQSGYMHDELLSKNLTGSALLR